MSSLASFFTSNCIGGEGLRNPDSDRGPIISPSVGGRGGGRYTFYTPTVHFMIPPPPTLSTQQYVGLHVSTSNQKHKV